MGVWPVLTCSRWPSPPTSWRTLCHSRHPDRPPWLHGRGRCSAVESPASLRTPGSSKAAGKPTRRAPWNRHAPPVRSRPRTLARTLKWGRITWRQRHTDMVQIMVSSDPSCTLAGEATGQRVLPTWGHKARKRNTQDMGAPHRRGCGGSPGRPGTEGTQPDGAGQQTGGSLQKLMVRPGAQFPAL